MKEKVSEYDLEISHSHARIQEFLSGGGGGGARPDGQKTAWTTFFFNPQLILQLTEGVQWFYCRGKRKLYFPKDPEGDGSNVFQGGGGGLEC